MNTLLTIIGALGVFTLLSATEYQQIIIGLAMIAPIALGATT